MATRIIISFAVARPLYRDQLPSIYNASIQRAETTIPMPANVMDGMEESEAAPGWGVAVVVDVLLFETVPFRRIAFALKFVKLCSPPSLAFTLNTMPAPQ